MLDPGTPQNARNHEELNQFLRDINTLPEGTNPDDFENIKFEKISNFLKSESSVGINCEDFVEIIKSAELKDSRFKLFLIQDFLKSQGSIEINGEDFIKIIKAAELKDDRPKLFLIDNFLKSQGSIQINGEDFIKIIKSVEFKEDDSKSELINNFLESGRSSNVTPQDLANMIKEVGLQNRADLSINLYLTKFSESENYIDFTKALHPSEAMQCEFVKKFIKKNQIKQNNVMGLKPFIEELQDNDLALDLIKNLSGERILVNAKDTLSLVKNRSKKQYAFLTEIVGDKILEDCITSEGIANLKATFGKDLKVDNQLITVSDLISYYDMVNQTSALSALLKPEFKEQLRDNFSPSAEMLLYKPTELDKLNSLLGQRGIEFDVKSYLIENTILSAHLKAKVGNISEIDSSKTYQINFTNFGFDNSSQDHSHLEKQVQTNALFNSLLQSQDPNKEEVVKFFSDLLGIAFSDSDGDKLKTFFQQNKKELAHCFCDENLPKENFESLFTTLRDGCFANIGTQFTSMLYGAMIKDEEAQILYGVMSSKIIAPIGANQDINHNGNPLDNTIIKSYSLSPMALVTKTSQEEMLTNQKTWEIIGKIAGDDKKNEIYKKFFESYPDTTIFNQKAKEIASFLIVKEIVGEEKIKDLTSKNPQLKELGDFVLDLGVGDISQSSQGSQQDVSSPQSSQGSQQDVSSPQSSQGSQQDVSSPQSSQRVQEDGSPAPRVGCFNLSSFFSCLRGQRS